MSLGEEKSNDEFINKFDKIQLLEDKDPNIHYKNNKPLPSLKQSLYNFEIQNDKKPLFVFPNSNDYLNNEKEFKIPSIPTYDLENIPPLPSTFTSKSNSNLNLNFNSTPTPIPLQISGSTSNYDYNLKNSLFKKSHYAKIFLEDGLQDEDEFIPNNEDGFFLLDINKIQSHNSNSNELQSNDNLFFNYTNSNGIQSNEDLFFNYKEPTNSKSCQDID